MTNFSQVVVENIKKKHIFSHFPENRAVYEIKLKKMVEPDRLQMTIRRMRFACWIPKAADTQSEYLIFIVSGYANALQYYVICTLPELSHYKSNRITGAEMAQSV
jgi:hypothetical protein